MSEVLAILKELIALATPSGSEAAAVDLLRARLEAAGLRPTVSGRNLYCVRGRGERNLLLNSHTDTVPASDSWQRNPLEPTEENGRLYGLGAADAKSCVAAMFAAFVTAEFDEASGSLTFAATCDEEAGSEGLEVLLPELPEPTAAVIGEPTSLNITLAQKGNLRVDLVARTDGGHASRPRPGANAVEQILDDLQRLREWRFENEHPLLGGPTLVPTLIDGGTAQNVIPPVCTVRLDVRSTPAYPNDVLLAGIRERVASEVVVIRNRTYPVETDPATPIVAIAQQASPQADLIGSSGVSDLRFLGDTPGVVIGPADNQLSHRADEYVEIEMLNKAVEAYRTIAELFLSADYAD